MFMQNKKPYIAVLLAAYNGRERIEEQINSILSQKNVNINIFISVDISNDDTLDFCNRLEQESDYVTVLPYGEHFGVAAKNFYRLIRDVDFSNFDYVSLADQDDIWYPEKLAHAVNTLQNNNALAYSSDVMAFWDNKVEKLVKKSFPQKRFDYYFGSPGPGCTYVLNCDSAMLLKVFINNNWENVNYTERHDWLIYAFFRSRGMPWYIDSKVLMLYRQHESNQEGAHLGFKSHLTRIKMINNGWYRTEVRKISELICNDDSNAFNLDRWFLIKNFYQLRRNKRDAFFLLLMLLTGVF